MIRGTDMPLIEIDVSVVHLTKDAILFDNGKKEVWVPRSLIRDQCGEEEDITSIFLTEWVATNKGLI